MTNLTLKHSLLALAISGILTGCSLEGDDGAQGAIGETGAKGVQGEKGDTGETGAQGEKGDQGETGAQGEKGDQGETGAQGEKGDTGETGAQGEKGDQGETGAQGQSGYINQGLTRLATVPLGAEVTGAFVSKEGYLFFNAQHPDSANTATDKAGKMINKGTVGAVTGINLNQLPKSLPELPLAKTDAEKQSVRVAIGEYQVLGQNGDTYNNTIQGASALGHIMDSTRQNLVVDTDMPDFNGFISTGEGEGYLFTNWEYVPGGMSRMRLKMQDDFSWKVDFADMIDFSSVHGTAANCFGSMTPWDTPLTSEEWTIDDDLDRTSAGWNTRPNNFQQSQLTKFVDFDADGSDFPNPYRYGYIVEIKDPTEAKPEPVKHFTIGRVEHENSVVMPDRKTVYTTQDDTGGLLLKFVADQAEDLSSGTLYAAKLTQDKSNEPLVTGFDVSWVELASGNNAQIEAWVAQFDGVKADPDGTGEEQYLTIADVKAWANGDATYPLVTNDKDTTGNAITAGKPMDNRVAFLETRQAAKAKGATAEFRKLEGINVNIKRAMEAVEGKDMIDGEDVNKAYVYFAISDIDSTMTDGTGDIALNTRVKDCGGVYRMPLEANYNVSRIEPILMGSTMVSGVSGSEKCAVDQIAQPDNVLVLDDGRIMIGEDGSQTNNTLWLFDPKVAQ
ncbi:cell surface protein [Saccharobesus litoralis]|uniref:Cell surface protein n=1 Tax=Saccharobesus litoralis TaxID=2172099 RepID=A0A2S0VNS7_9ALTE|nr:alkaline phosphatase PhoX [Saccharobesus litoralis]AWB65740.1 cell surface protein [Saccharobesus litoralis]